MEEYSLRLSVIIVNYNVEFFLDQCLYSVFRALEKIEGEVFVVDNDSEDGSVEMVRRKYPEVQLIANRENAGFSRANNQALERVNGQYALLLNPDTMVEEDTFEKVLTFMDEHPDAGGLGVKMLDGTGDFLPESKRGLPTPSVAFYKIFGLSGLFPHSRKFGRYHLSYLDEDEVHEIEVLSGAFMLLRKKALDEVGLLDPTFFMYGEDIDLSYRLIKGGYRNYYYPETRIVHYKGESTRKTSIHYVFIFYKAMLIFADKHFNRRNTRFLSAFIDMAIYLRAGLAIVNRFLLRLLLPLADLILILGGVLLLQSVTPGIRDLVWWQTLPVLIGGWVLGVLLAGGYDKPLKQSASVKGWGVVTMFFFAFQGFFPEIMGLPLEGLLVLSGWSLFALVVLRRVFRHFRIHGYEVNVKLNRRFLIIGEQDEAERASVVLKQTNLYTEFIGLVSPDPQQEQDEEEGILGNIGQLRELCRQYRIDEVIFCSRDVPAHRMIREMIALRPLRVDNKVAPPGSLYIIGSNSVENSGELYMLDINAVNKPGNRRNKRLFDLTLSLFLLITLPVGVLFVREKKKFLKNIVAVLIGERSWVGYKAIDAPCPELPRLRPGVLSPTDALEGATQEIARRLNIIYAKDYRVSRDLGIILQCLDRLGGEEQESPR